MSAPTVTNEEAEGFFKKGSPPRKRMANLEGRCKLHFGSQIKDAIARWTPTGEDDICVELVKWDGSSRVVPQRELERVGV